MSPHSLDSILKQAKEGIAEHLKKSRETGKIDEELYDIAIANTYPTLEAWLNDPDIDVISPRLKKGIVNSIQKEHWQDLVNAFRQSVRFGTGGIRGMMAFDKASIIKLKEEGIDTDILRGPNTINDLVMLLTSAGVARFGMSQDPPLKKVVVGYDSRIRGHDFAKIVAELFLGYGYTVYFFDAPCPYPEVTFAIPHESVKADIGVLISASHNDYRYNGYKLSCANGSQFDPAERDEMYHKYIINTETRDIVGHIRSFKDAPEGKLFFLGGDEPVSGFDYGGREDFVINMHECHRDHIKTFLMTEDLDKRQNVSPHPLHIAFCPFHGSGLVAVPRLLREVGFVDIKSINGNKSRMGLNELNGLFPAFRSDPGKEQQPDPGDPRAARTAIKAFKEDYPGEFENMDILIGTDPDADRCGIVVKVPPEQRHIYGNLDYYLLPADDVWTLVLWYRLHREMERYGKVKDAEKKFVVLSHTTSDSITFLARKHGLGVIKSWVGFAALAAVTRDTWNRKEKEFLGLVDGRDERYKDLCHPFTCQCFGMENGQRSINVAAMEQSNGFSILGGPPPDNSSLGTEGHVRDKDGTFAGLLVAEIAAWAKERGTSLIELLDRYIYLDPDIGLFATFYEPDPLDGEYPGIEGDRLKKNILLKALELHRLSNEGKLEIAGRKVRWGVIYRTGKYDEIYPPSEDYRFPDEGVRLFFDEERLQHITIRPSGTGNSLRFHIQLHEKPTEANLVETKARLRSPEDGEGMKIMNELRRLLDAPRR
jgi:phosphomannomutase